MCLHKMAVILISKVLHTGVPLEATSNSICMQAQPHSNVGVHYIYLDYSRTAGLQNLCLQNTICLSPHFKWADAMLWVWATVIFPPSLSWTKSVSRPSAACKWVSILVHTHKHVGLDCNWVIPPLQWQSYQQPTNNCLCSHPTLYMYAQG